MQSRWWVWAQRRGGVHACACCISHRQSHPCLVGTPVSSTR
jgi:hypothetical protein